MGVTNGKRSQVSHRLFGSAVKEFEITVPDDYNSAKQIDRFVAQLKAFDDASFGRNGKHYSHFFPNIQDLPDIYFEKTNFSGVHFRQPTHVLEPGATYLVGLVPILARKISGTTCVDFLKKEGAVLTGPHGLTLVWQLKRDELPHNAEFVCLDKRKIFCKESSGVRCVPRIRRFEDPDAWYIDLVDFDCVGPSRILAECGHYLLRFHKAKHACK